MNIVGIDTLKWTALCVITTVLIYLSEFIRIILKSFGLDWFLVGLTGQQYSENPETQLQVNVVGFYSSRNNSTV